MQEQVEPHARRVYAEHMLAYHEMAGAGYRQKLGDALQHGQYGDLQHGHRLV